MDCQMDFLYAELPFVGGSYCVRWVLNSNGAFSVVSYYEHLRNASRKSFSMEMHLVYLCA